MAENRRSLTRDHNFAGGLSLGVCGRVFSCNHLACAYIMLSGGRKSSTQKGSSKCFFALCELIVRREGADVVQLFLHRFRLTFHFGQCKITDQNFVARGWWLRL